MNLLIIAATMILSKHLKLDLKCLGESECLILSMVAIRISKVGCQKVTKNRVNLNKILRKLEVRFDPSFNSASESKSVGEFFSHDVLEASRSLEKKYTSHKLSLSKFFLPVVNDT